MKKKRRLLDIKSRTHRWILPFFFFLVFIYTYFFFLPRSLQLQCMSKIMGKTNKRASSGLGFSTTQWDLEDVLTHLWGFFIKYIKNFKKKKKNILETRVNYVFYYPKNSLKRLKQAKLKVFYYIIYVQHIIKFVFIYFMAQLYSI